MSEIGTETDPDKIDKLSIEKCFFKQKIVKYLDHIVSEIGIETDPDKTDKLSIENCFFMQKIVNFLGHIVSEFGIETDPDKTEKVKVSRVRNSFSSNQPQTELNFVQHQQPMYFKKSYIQ